MQKSFATIMVYNKEIRLLQPEPPAKHSPQNACARDARPANICVACCIHGCTERASENPTSVLAKIRWRKNNASCNAILTVTHVSPMWASIYGNIFLRRTSRNGRRSNARVARS